MGIALGRLVAGRSVVPRAHDEESGQTIISGMGELHLEIIVDRMKREFGVEANVGKPQVAYRETIRRRSRTSKASSCASRAARASMAHVVLSIVEPQEPGTGFTFVDAIKGGVVPREFIPAVEKGLIDTLPNGAGGFPWSTSRSTLTFGSYHDVDSNEKRVQDGLDGFQDGCRKASPVILEPMMAVEVETPEDYAGSVMGDLSSRRGMVQGMDDMVGGGKIIKAEVPLSEMFGYSTTLRSATQGRATYTMEFSTTAKRRATSPNRSSPLAPSDRALNRCHRCHPRGGGFLSPENLFPAGGGGLSGPEDVKPRSGNVL